MSDEMNKDTEIVDDVVFEATEEGEGEALSKDKIKKLREDLKTAQSEKADYLASWQKERADFINYKKGEDDRRKQISEYARESFLEDLLPVLDGFDMAFGNKEAWEKVDQSWRTGIEYIHQQFVKVLEDNGIAQVSPSIGEKVDVTIHEVMGTMPTDDESKEDSVASVMQKGYKVKDRVVRPARVKAWKKE